MYGVYSSDPIAPFPTSPRGRRMGQYPMLAGKWARGNKRTTRVLQVPMFSVHESSKFMSEVSQSVRAVIPRLVVSSPYKT